MNGTSSTLILFDDYPACVVGGWGRWGGNGVGGSGEIEFILFFVWQRQSSGEREGEKWI